MGEYTLSLSFYKNRVQMLIWGVKNLFIGIGVISTLWVFIGSVIPHCHQFLVAFPAGFWNVSFSITSLRDPSPLPVYILLHVIIILTAVASCSSSAIFRRPIQLESCLKPNSDWTSLESYNNEEHNQFGQSQPSTTTTIPEEIMYDLAADDQNHQITVLTDELRIRGDDVDENEEEEEDTLESMWKAIADEKENPANGRQLKKCDTWEAPPRVEEKSSPPGTNPFEEHNQFGQSQPSTTTIPEEIMQDLAADDRNHQITILTDELRIRGDDVDENEEEEDTLESTWKAIADEMENPANGRQLKKCDTWEAPPRVKEKSPPPGGCWRELRKSETFNDAVSGRRRGGMMREASLGPEELNKRVEDFIAKFNRDMRLQRQQSDDRYLDMIRRGV